MQKELDLTVATGPPGLFLLSLVQCSAARLQQLVGFIETDFQDCKLTVFGREGFCEVINLRAELPDHPISLRLLRVPSVSSQTRLV